MKGTEKKSSQKGREELPASNILLLHCHVRNILLLRCARETKGGKEGEMTSIFMCVNAVKRESEETAPIYTYICTFLEQNNYFQLMTSLMHI